MNEKTTPYGSPLFSGMPPEKIDKIVSAFPRSKIRQGTVFVKEGKKTGKVFWVLKGNVAVQWVWEGSPKLTAFINTAPCLLCHLESWKDEPALANLIALDDLEVVEIERTQFLALVQTHHQVAINLASHTGNIFAETIRVHHQFLFGKAEEVVARCVFFLVRLYGRAQGERTYLDTLSTRSQIALLSGLSRRATIAAIQELEDAGVLATEGRKLVVLDEKKLRRLSGKGFSQ